MTVEERGALAAKHSTELEALSFELMGLLRSQPAVQLIAYLWGQILIGHVRRSNKDEAPEAIDVLGEISFVLEYAHATWACYPEEPVGELDEAVCGEIVETARKLRMSALLCSVFSSEPGRVGPFGKATAEVEFHAKSSWILIRGHRYQVLEGEFYRFALAPHDDALRRHYGAGSDEIAAGMQAISDATRSGAADAVEMISNKMSEVRSYQETHGVSYEEALKATVGNDKEATTQAIRDLLFGGTANVSQHTKLPATLLADLSYERGDNQDFIASGELSGTPLRSLPVRTRPLIRLDGEYYAPDPSFVRDSGYRALQWHLSQHEVGYSKTWNDRQKELTETAFQTILNDQLGGGRVLREIWYRDTITHQWVENDVLILLDDVMVVLEAKGGAAATIASPATDLDRHMRAVQDLVVKAYEQCRRLIEYLSTADEVPIFERKGGRYQEVAKIRISEFRVVLPIGLTMESFSPYSTICKELPSITPIVGKHAFVSLGIDELFVLKRFLPSPGAFFHYLSVRQVLAGLRGARLFDEFDHLGAYITKNRFDMDIREQLKKPHTIVTWDGFSSKVDEYFAMPDWEDQRPPQQEMPPLLEALLDQLNQSRSDGWLLVDATIRDQGKEGREDFARSLGKVIEGLKERPYRYFSLATEPPLFLWVMAEGNPFDQMLASTQAAAQAVALSATSVAAVAITATTNGTIVRAIAFPVVIPPRGTREFDAVAVEAAKARKRVIRLSDSSEPLAKIGRNDPCWCGSGKKYKRCHGVTDVASK